MRTRSRSVKPSKKGFDRRPLGVAFWVNGKVRLHTHHLVHSEDWLQLAFGQVTASHRGTLQRDPQTLGRAVQCKLRAVKARGVVIGRWLV